MMRLRAFAGFAALGAAAADFEDDDLNFLRLLSTNASGNATTAPATTVVDANATTAPATTVPATTVVDPNATTVPATTVPATTVVDANATTVPATTVAATTVVDANATTVPATTAVSVTKAGETKASDATTVAATGGAGETTGPSQTEPVQGEKTTAPPAVTITKLCSAEAYESVGLTPPATFLDTMADYALKVDCSDSSKLNKPGDPSSVFYRAGPRATTSANLAKCESPATVIKITCGGSTALGFWNDESLYEKQGVLMKCCGAAPGFLKPSLAKYNNVGDLKWENFTDSKCETSSTFKPEWPMSDVVSANPHTFELNKCVDMGGANPGYYMNFAMCNTTHYARYEYFNTPCTDAEFSGADMVELGQCKPGSTYNGTITGYEKWTCDAKDAPNAKKTFSTTLKIEFAGLAGMSVTQLAAVKTTYETKSLDTFKTALANPAAEITPTHTYSGALVSRRRLSGATRRLSGSGGVTSVFVTTLPAAAADAAQAVIVAKTTGTSAALTPAAFKTTIETELASNDATKAFASNITATVAAPVVSLPAPAPETPTTPGGTTSGAMTNLLGFGSALLMATCLLM